MALTKCLNCGKDVSSEDSQCYNCGHPIKAITEDGVISGSTNISSAPYENCVKYMRFCAIAFLVLGIISTLVVWITLGGIGEMMKYGFMDDFNFVGFLIGFGVLLCGITSWAFLTGMSFVVESVVSMKNQIKG